MAKGQGSKEEVAVMGWEGGKSRYEWVVERVLIELSSSIRLANFYRYNRSTWFSRRLRYDFVLGTPYLCWPNEHGLDTGVYPYLIEVQGEQHYPLYYSQHGNNNDSEKEWLATKFGCPLLVIPYSHIYTTRSVVNPKLREFIEVFLKCDPDEWLEVQGRNYGRAELKGSKGLARIRAAQRKRWAKGKGSKEEVK